VTDNIMLFLMFVSDVYTELRRKYLASGSQLLLHNVIFTVTGLLLVLNISTVQTLIVSQMCSSFGDRTFAAAGPQVWNSLPPSLRLCELSYGQFRRLLKTFLFGQ